MRRALVVACTFGAALAAHSALEDTRCGAYEWLGAHDGPPHAAAPQLAPGHVAQATGTAGVAAGPSLGALSYVAFNTLATLLFPVRMLALGSFIIISDTFTLPMRTAAAVVGVASRVAAGVFAPLFYVLAAIKAVVITWPTQLAAASAHTVFSLYVVSSVAVIMGCALGALGVTLLAAEHTVYSIRTSRN